MFRAIILPIFGSTRLCVTACGIMHLRCCQLAISWVRFTTSCNAQSSAPEDGQNNCQKHVDLIGIINKPLLLHLVGCLYFLYQWCTVKQISNVGWGYLRTGCWGRYFGLRETRWQRSGENYIMTSLRICTLHEILTLILRRSRTGTVWFYTSTSNKRAARPKLYTKSLTRDLKLMYNRLTLVRISIKL